MGKQANDTDKKKVKDSKVSNKKKPIQKAEKQTKASQSKNVENKAAPKKVKVDKKKTSKVVDYSSSDFKSEFTKYTKKGKEPFFLRCWGYDEKDADVQPLTGNERDLCLAMLSRYWPREDLKTIKECFQRLIGRSFKKDPRKFFGRLLFARNFAPFEKKKLDFWKVRTHNLDLVNEANGLVDEDQRYNYGVVFDTSSEELAKWTKFFDNAKFRQSEDVLDKINRILKYSMDEVQRDHKLKAHFIATATDKEKAVLEGNQPSKTTEKSKALKTASVTKTESATTPVQRTGPATRSKGLLNQKPATPKSSNRLESDLKKEIVEKNKQKNKTDPNTPVNHPTQNAADAPTDTNVSQVENSVQSQPSSLIPVKSQPFVNQPNQNDPLIGGMSPDQASQVEQQVKEIVKKQLEKNAAAPIHQFQATMDWPTANSNHPYQPVARLQWYGKVVSEKIYFCDPILEIPPSP